ncbi:glycosyltransferase [Deminuibacter soli]|uniref:Glycosyltransferase n=1 Tax=Deminuibacter soli TaxID=2291815 RepID=A0A3E1NQB6_9BACT|nr:glycosyltransferase [Deminuibacter soli]RFM29988.1 glycosyltransferase [Deminuibacter soli]
MLNKKINIPTVLVAPLDWGLGHTTRCVPIIRQLQHHGYKVIVAAEGPALFLLRQEFPGIDYLELKGYRIQYAKYKRLLPLKILLQLPKIFFAIRYEHRWLQQKIKELPVQMVISDNRYGLWSKAIPSIFVTHQLQIQTPFTWLTRFVQILNYRYIRHFNTCWVPDTAGSFNVAGNLSHPQVLPRVPVVYTGLLSRLQTLPLQGAAMRYRWLFLLSGPEPQRSLLQQKLLQLAAEMDENVLLVLGRPGSTAVTQGPANCTVINHLSSENMQQAFAGCDFVLSRSGYTTVMELLLLQKKALLVPTPGQTEQEYLAGHLQQQQWCYTCTQNELTIEQLHAATQFHYQLPAFTSTGLDEAIQAMPWDNQKTRTA